MTRSLFDPTDIPATVKRLCRLRGHVSQPLTNYLADPTSLQRLQPLSAWHLRNLRSDLSAWRTALEMLPTGMILTIPWIGLVCPDKSEIQIKAALYELRTSFYGDDLLIGSYQTLMAFDTSVQLRGQTASLPLALPLPDPENQPYRSVDRVPVRQPALHVPLPLEKRIDAIDPIAHRYLKPQGKQSGFISQPESPEQEEVDDLAPLLEEQKLLSQKKMDLLLEDPVKKVELRHVEHRLSELDRLLNNIQ